MHHQARTVEEHLQPLAGPLRGGAEPTGHDVHQVLPGAVAKHTCVEDIDRVDAAPHDVVLDDPSEAFDIGELGHYQQFPGNARCCSEEFFEGSEILEVQLSPSGRSKLANTIADGSHWHAGPVLW